MSPPGGSAATLSNRAPTPTTAHPEWDTEDILIAAARLRAYGWTEQAAILAFDYFRQQRVKRIGRLVRRMSERQLAAHLRGFESEASRIAASRARGDLLQIRSDRRWPWRTSTAQSPGGSHA